MLLKQHLDMIGRNEPIQRKAKFWQSYVRALKDDPQYLSEDIEDAHQRRMDAISDLLPMKYRYPHFYHPERSSSVPPPPRSSSVPPTTLRALSRARSSTPAPPHLLRDILEERFPAKPTYTYTGERLNEAFNHEMSKGVTSYASSSSDNRLVSRTTTTYTPVRSTRINSEIIHAYMGHSNAYAWPDADIAGEPLYHRPYYGSYVRRPLAELLEPSTYLPRSRITRDPWWWDYPTLRPYSPYNRYPYSSYRPYSPYWRDPYYLRDSYLSPIKRTYLWSYHPVRPFSYNYYWI